MAACAADDHLNLIATAATSDGGIETIAQTTARISSNPQEPAGGGSSSRTGRPSSCVHVWDAEMMTLIGTLLFPCLHLTRDLANAATAFGMSRSRRSTVICQSDRVDGSTASTQAAPAASAGDAAGPPSAVGEWCDQTRLR